MWVLANLSTNSNVMGLALKDKPSVPVQNKYALLIGVEEFDDPQIGRLNTVSVDVQRFSDLLNDRDRSDFVVSTLLNPQFVEARKQISEVCRKAKENDVIFFYYSGHGLLGEHRSLYLIFSDSDSKYLDATCLETEFILSQFRKSACRNFIVVADCCHSGAFFNNVRGVPKGLYALTACDEDETTMENEKGGVFTNIIVTGLTSDYIDADRDGRITFSELFSYIIDEVKEDPLTPRDPQKWEWNVSRDISIFESPKPVFISYRRTQKVLVNQLSEKLRDKGITTFVDTEKLRIGDDWKYQLERVIKNARVMIFVIDAEIIYSKVAMWEIETADAHGIPILPIMVEEIRLPGMFENKFGHINRVIFDMTTTETEIDNLIDHIRKLRIRKPTSIANKPVKDPTEKLQDPESTIPPTR